MSPKRKAKPWYVTPLEGYIWCETHGDVHPAKEDYYDEHEPFCNDDHWETLFIDHEYWKKGYD